MAKRTIAERLSKAPMPENNALVIVTQNTIPCLITPSGMTTRIGTVFLFKLRMRLHLMNQLNEHIRRSIQFVDMFTGEDSKWLDEQFTIACNKAMVKARNKNDKTTRRGLVEGIKKHMFDCANVIIGNLDVLRID